MPTDGARGRGAGALAAMGKYMGGWGGEGRELDDLLLFLFPPCQAMDLECGLDIKRSNLVEVEGIPLLKETANKWDLLWGFKARPDDLLICTYPKAGK